MAKRVGVVLSGCGAADGSEIREALFTLLSIERAGAEVICAAPDVPQAKIVNHLTGEVEGGAPGRRVLVEAARIARGQVRDLAELQVEDVDAVIFPGGFGVASTLSTYGEKGALCEVNADVVRLLKGLLASHRPMGFICLAPILAARVLGPVAGVRLTLGARGSAPAKHAAVMGADVRPCPVSDIVIDQKARVVSTPAYMYDDARLSQVASAIDKVVRSVLSLARDRSARAAPTLPAADAKSTPTAAIAPRDQAAAAEAPAVRPSIDRPRRRVITPGPGSA